MESDKIAGLIALGWLIGAVLLAARLVRRGQRLAATFAERHPQTYQALGRPQPGFFYSAERNQFARFLARRDFEKLGDPGLAAEFEEYRNSEVRLLLTLLGSLAVVVLVIVGVRHTP